MKLVQNEMSTAFKNWTWSLISYKDNGYTKHTFFAQSAWAVEYTDCFSAEG